MSAIANSGASDDEAEWVDLDSITQPVRVRKSDGTVVSAPMEPEKARKGLGMAAISVVVVLAVVVCSLGAVGLYLKRKSDQDVSKYEATSERISATSTNQMLSFSYPSDWQDHSQALSATTSWVQKDAVVEGVPSSTAGHLLSPAGLTLIEKNAETLVPDLATAQQILTTYTSAVQAKQIVVDATGTGCKAETLQLAQPPRTLVTAQVAAAALRYDCQSQDGGARQVWQLRGYFPGQVVAGSRTAGRLFVLNLHGQQRYWTINKGLLDELGAAVKVEGASIN